MADPITSSQHQEVSMGTSTTVTTVVSTDTQDGEIPTVHLKLRKPKSGRKVQWTTETVDNEYMNKKKSKCCCIYKKKKEFGESSSSEDDSDDECDQCKGHVEKNKTKHAKGAACTPTENGDTTIITERPPTHEKNENPPPSDPPV